MEKQWTNELELSFPAKSMNEGLARMTVAAFLTEMNPTISEVDDVKTAVSEAVTNAIVHGYRDENQQVHISCRWRDQLFQVEISDHGIGIEDVQKAREPFFTTRPEENRVGMGFAFMEAFMDEVEIYSKPREGTRVILRKHIGKEGVS